MLREFANREVKHHHHSSTRHARPDDHHHHHRPQVETAVVSTAQSRRYADKHKSQRKSKSPKRKSSPVQQRFYEDDIQEGHAQFYSQNASRDHKYRQRDSRQLSDTDEEFQGSKRVYQEERLTAANLSAYHQARHARNKSKGRRDSNQYSQLYESNPPQPQSYGEFHGRGQMSYGHGHHASSQMVRRDGRSPRNVSTGH